MTQPEVINSGTRFIEGARSYEVGCTPSAPPTPTPSLLSSFGHACNTQCYLHAAVPYSLVHTAAHWFCHPCTYSVPCFHSPLYITF